MNHRNVRNEIPQRLWIDNVYRRGTAILMRLVMTILRDSGDEYNRATKAKIRQISRNGNGKFIFILEVYDDMDRGMLIGESCLHLSCLNVLFAAALKATFPAAQKPQAIVGIWDNDRQRVLMPQELWLESELEPEKEVDTPKEPVDLP